MASARRRLLKYNTPRRTVQFLSFVFFSAIVFNLGVLPLVFPVLWAWGLPQNVAGDAFSQIQLALYAGVFPLLGVAAFLIVGVLMGKAMCGWICPFGFVVDLMDFVKRKRTDVSPRTHETLMLLKYGILAATLFMSGVLAAATAAGVGTSYRNSLGVFAQAPFTALSPAETLFATVPRLIGNGASSSSLDVGASLAGLPALFWVQGVIMVAVLVFAALVTRSWCRYLCPHGAIMAIMNRFSFIGLRRDLHKCPKGTCRNCAEVCPMRVKILDLPWEKFSDPECIYCMKCVDACENGAIKVTYP